MHQRINRIVTRDVISHIIKAKRNQSIRGIVAIDKTMLKRNEIIIDNVAANKILN
jgi:hypothetical protein